MKLSPQISEELHRWLRQDEVTDLEALALHILAQTVVRDERMLAPVFTLVSPRLSHRFSSRKHFVVFIGHASNLIVSIISVRRKDRLKSWF